MNHFEVGDMAVYQGQGVGQITGIDKMEVGGASLEVYTLQMESGTIVRVPTHKATTVGLRELIAAEAVPQVYDILREAGQGPRDKTWNRRYRAYSDKLRMGTVSETAEVMRDLYRLQGNKELSYGERQMLDQARRLLVRELSLATQRDEGEVAQELEDLFVADC